MTPLAALPMLKQTQKRQALIPAATRAPEAAAGAGEEALLGGGSRAALTGQTGPSIAIPCFYPKYFQG